MRSVWPCHQAVVSSAVGSITVKIEVTAVIMRGVVSLPHGWLHDSDHVQLSVAQSRPGVNSNRLTDDGVVDPLTGTAVLNAIPVDVSPT
jgi:anaerobic selenocysteine-containing dehydrogenase